jgi:hypothetical protein
MCLSAYLCMLGGYFCECLEWGKAKGRSLGANGSSDPMREAGGPSTEVVVPALGLVPAPTGIVMLALQTLLRNASMAQS